MLPDRSVQVLRLLWMLLFGFAVLADIAGAVYALRDAYEVRPVFARWGLDYDVKDDGVVWVGTVADRNGRQKVETTARLIELNGEAIQPDAHLPRLTERLQAAKGPGIAIALKQPDGRVVELQQGLVQPKVDPSARRQRDLRLTARLGSALLACTILLVCSLLLQLRRPNDPVATIFSFAFAGMAATIDPPIQMWMGLGLPLVIDTLSGIWFYLLLIGFATFPDGVFVPKAYRWLLVAGIPLSIFLCLPNVDELAQAFIGIGALLAMLVGQVLRYRRLSDGIERQQIKWAGFGFAVGLLLLLAAFVVVSFIPDRGVDQNPWVNLLALLLFSVGMTAIPLGLLIALTRFRLWEADTVITRSAAYAVVTLVVGVVWAASSDLVRMIIEQVIGRESQAGATTAGAVIAAGIFSPTQSLVLGWTRKRFGGPMDRIHGAAKRLKSWGVTETPAEVATRALAIIDDAVHPSAAAIVLDTAIGRELIAARDVTSPDDSRLSVELTLEDEESSVGTLLLGRRSDGNRYSGQELEAVREIIPSLAEALRVARGRYSRESMMQQRLDEMAARLAQLEGGTPKPA